MPKFLDTSSKKAPLLECGLGLGTHCSRWMTFKTWSKTLQAVSGSPDPWLLGDVSRHVVRRLKQPRGDTHVLVTEASCHQPVPEFSRHEHGAGPSRPRQAFK